MAQTSDPKLMMLDEPASGLSRGERIALTDLLLALDPSITLIIIEHDMDVALRVAHSVTMMHDGRKVIEGHPGRDPGEPARARSLPRHLPSRSDRMSDTPVLAVRELNAFYGRARALEDVSFEMGKESVAIIGRNGMGKTTLCNSIMGIAPPQPSGSIRFQGEELLGKASHTIASRGIGYVPQGRRLFPSLTVEEHLRMIRPAREVAGDGRNWTMSAVYDLFPRLAERKGNGGAQLSGGEQQMLAIGRALMTNPLLLIMDEPSEGWRPRSSSTSSASSARSRRQGSRSS